MIYYSYGYDMIGYGFIVIGFLITLAADIYMQSTYRKYKRKENTKKITGAEVAREILSKNNLENVYVVETRGSLTDHYDPRQKVVRLSTDIYNGTSIASVSVAAHEVGHAIQDKEGYTFMRIRSFLVPLVNFGSRFGYIAVVLGLIFGVLNLAWAGVGLLLLILLFQLVTLPVEIDASKRAKKELSRLRLIGVKENDSVAKMLRAAAMTYVASLVTTLTEVLRLVLMIVAQDQDS